MVHCSITEPNHEKTDMKKNTPEHQKEVVKPQEGVVFVRTSIQFDIDVSKHLSATGLTILCRSLGADPFLGEPIKSLNGVVYCLEYSKNIYVLYQISINKSSGDVDEIHLVSIQGESEPESKKKEKEADKKLNKFKSGAKKVGIGVGVKEIIDFIINSLF